MHSIVVDNVNRALALGLEYLLEFGDRETSRNGLVLVAPNPVTTTYLNPRRRVLFSPMRDANPFFHLMESLWMLAGRNDVEFPAQFAKQLRQYSDDGETLHGAYGFRWRRWFKYDQLEDIATELISNRNSRRAVLTMWNAATEHSYEPWQGNSDSSVAIIGGKDVPCNTHAYFDVRNDMLNMTVCCRSNDIYWGAYGANAVHFSFLQEFLAAWIGVPVGVYRQMSNNYHIYTDVVSTDKFEALAEDARKHDLYGGADPVHLAATTKLVNGSIANFEEQLAIFFKDPSNLADYYYSENFIGKVVVPMYRAWHNRRSGVSSGLAECDEIASWDWRIACFDWISRREAKKAGIVNA